MSENKFELGDVVVLKSDGPKMTIMKIIETTPPNPPAVECEWFNKDGKLEHASFYVTSLKKVS